MYYVFLVFRYLYDVICKSQYCHVCVKVPLNPNRPPGLARYSEKVFVIVAVDFY